MPDQFDDPNETIAALMDATKPWKLQMELSPTKLRLPYGDTVITLLSQLANVVVSRSMQWQSPELSGKQEVADTMVETIDEDEATPQVIDDTWEDNSDEDEPIFDISKKSHQEEPMADTTQSFGKFDQSEWLQEVERVTPLLKFQIKNDHSDWRIHLQQMAENEKAISQSFSATSGSLHGLEEEISKTLEKINSREKYLNEQLEPQIKEYKLKSQTLSQLRLDYQKASGSISQLSNDLAKITDELEELKSQMDDLGSGMTDAKPLVAIKQALATLKSDIRQLDLRTGVVQHHLWHARMNDKATLNMNLEKLKQAKTMTLMA